MVSTHTSESLKAAFHDIEFYRRRPRNQFVCDIALKVPEKPDTIQKYVEDTYGYDTPQKREEDSQYKNLIHLIAEAKQLGELLTQASRDASNSYDYQFAINSTGTAVHVTIFSPEEDSCTSHESTLRQSRDMVDVIHSIVGIPTSELLNLVGAHTEETQIMRNSEFVTRQQLAKRINPQHVKITKQRAPEQDVIDWLTKNKGGRGRDF